MHSFYPRLALLIDGAWSAATDGHTRDVLDPATGQVIAQLPEATPADVARALAAAQRGFAHWRQVAPSARAALLVRAAALVRERADPIARTITLELGKPLAESLVEVERLAVVFEWHAAESLRAYGRVVPAAPGLHNQVLREPVGVVAAFTPWNGPGASPARKISAALAAGCAIIIKPAEETPGTAVALAQCLVDAGLPAGVLNLLFGVPGDISAQLIASPVVRAIAFTGSVPVGRQLATLAAQHLKPAIMELGGHSPVIVCADADAEGAAELSARTKYRNAGQICMSPTRFFVHASLYERFVERFVHTARAIRVGSGFEPGMEMGPMANARRREAIRHLVADARQRGARLRTGGENIGEHGFFYAPTVLTDVPEDSEILHIEPFGPVALIAPFSDMDDAIRRANSTVYGLAAYAFTDSAQLVYRLGAELECGLVSINHFAGASHDMPFGGVKDSGYGREGGAECFDGYLVSKLVSQRLRA